MVTLQPSYLVSRGLARSSTNYRWRLRSTGSLQLRGFGHLQNAENMVIVSVEDKPNTENNTFPFTQSLTVAILRKVPKNYNENRNNIEAPKSSSFSCYSLHLYLIWQRKRSKKNLMQGKQSLGPCCKFLRTITQRHTKHFLSPFADTSLCKVYTCNHLGVCFFARGSRYGHCLLLIRGNINQV